MLQQVTEGAAEEHEGPVTVSEATAVPSAAGDRDELFTDEVPEDWDENASDFDPDEIARSWGEAAQRLWANDDRSTSRNT